ncbi:integral membrane protein [Klebsiella pneumoniae]|uniref:Integral membrane protein n=1 Tax=Klebsiella pneumoniae TaxID=573 RepID=A0A377TTQ8_KLEPN|nr:integral membrane protein [Klebsiella pneumoniae]
MRGCDLCRHWLAQHSAERISGFISLKILGLLVLTGWAGIVFSRRAIPAVPDVWYARIYVLLLCLVLLAMLIQ